MSGSSLGGVKQSGLVRWSGGDLRDRIDEVLLVFERAMGYPPSTGEARRGYVLVHTRRAGFRARAMLDDSDGSLVGFAYGYAGAAGQWWHDEVCRGLDPALAERWLGDSFELCELHVRPGSQLNGTGRALLTDLLSEVPSRTCVLSTPEGESTAHHLYERMGFVGVRRQHHFPGDSRGFAVLGRDLPLT